LREKLEVFIQSRAPQEREVVERRLAGQNAAQKDKNLATLLSVISLQLLRPSKQKQSLKWLMPFSTGGCRWYDFTN